MPRCKPGKPRVEIIMPYAAFADWVYTELEGMAAWNKETIKIDRMARTIKWKVRDHKEDDWTEVTVSAKFGIVTVIQTGNLSRIDLRRGLYFDMARGQLIAEGKTAL